MAGGGKKQTQTVRTRPDEQTAQYLEGTRDVLWRGANDIRSQGAVDYGGQSYFTGPQSRTVAEQIKPFMDPYQDQVVQGIRNEYDFLRGQAGVNADQAATQAGAFGGSRHGVAEAQRMANLDRQQAGQVAGLLSRGFGQAVQAGIPYAENQRRLREQQLQENIFRNQISAGLLLPGVQGGGQVQTTTMPRGSVLGGIASGALSGFGATGNPWGALIGGAAGAFS